MLDGLEFIAGRVALSVLADDPANARDIWDAGRGSVLPAVAAARYPDARAFCDAVSACRSAVPSVSAALGGGADVRQWHKVLAAGHNGAGHLNQPLSTAGYAKGACPQAWVNGVVIPGSRSRVLLETVGGAEIELSPTAAAQLVREAQLDALKLHPALPDTPVSAIVEVAQAAAEAGVTAFEPAGGLDLDATPRLLARLLEVPRLLFIPHVFGAVRDVNGRTDPHLVETLIERVVAAVT